MFPERARRRVSTVRGYYIQLSVIVAGMFLGGQLIPSHPVWWELLAYFASFAAVLVAVHLVLRHRGLARWRRDIAERDRQA